MVKKRCKTCKHFDEVDRVCENTSINKECPKVKKDVKKRGPTYKEIFDWLSEPRNFKGITTNGKEWFFGNDITWEVHDSLKSIVLKVAMEEKK